MNILWCGGEDIDFPNGSVTINTGTSYFRSSYARCCIYSSDPNTPLISKAFAGGAVTSAWLSCRLGTAGIGSTKPKLIGLAKSGTNGKGIYIDCNGTGGRIRVGTWDGSTFTALGTETNVSLISGVQKIDIQISSYGASATVNVYCNEQLIITYTGDISISGVSNLDCVSMFGYFYGGADTKTLFSEIVIADGDTRTLNLVTLYLNAAGDANDWDSGAYGDIDEVTVSDADLVYTNTDAKDAQFGLSNTPSGSFTVDAIKIVARATAPSGSTADTLKLGVKSGGVVDVDAGQTLTTAWDTYERLAATINSSQITTALLDAMQLNLRSAT